MGLITHAFQGEVQEYLFREENPDQISSLNNGQLIDRTNPELQAKKIDISEKVKYFEAKFKNSI